MQKGSKSIAPRCQIPYGTDRKILNTMLIGQES